MTLKIVIKLILKLIKPLIFCGFRCSILEKLKYIYVIYAKYLYGNLIIPFLSANHYQIFRSNFLQILRKTWITIHETFGFIYIHDSGKKHTFIVLEEKSPNLETHYYFYIIKFSF